MEPSHSVAVDESPGENGIIRVGFRSSKEEEMKTFSPQRHRDTEKDEKTEDRVKTEKQEGTEADIALCALLSSLALFLLVCLCVSVPRW
jgi:hypothetical protein